MIDVGVSVQKLGSRPLGTVEKVVGTWVWINWAGCDVPKVCHIKEIKEINQPEARIEAQNPPGNV